MYRVQRSRVFVYVRCERVQISWLSRCQAISVKGHSLGFSSYPVPLFVQKGGNNNESFHVTRSAERFLDLASVVALVVGGIVGIKGYSTLSLQDVAADETDAASKSGIISLKKRGDALSGNTCGDTKFYKDNAAEVLDLSTPEYRRIEILPVTDGIQNTDVFASAIAIARCGCSVTMEELTTACLKQGYVPQVTPEFRNITVGGAIMGAGVESSSGRFGEFSETCRAVTLRLADGRVVEVQNPSDSSKVEESMADEALADLFDALSGSYGSLATLLRAEIKLKKAEPHVRLTYTWYEGETQFEPNRATRSDLSAELQKIGPSSLDHCAFALAETSQRHDFSEALSFVDNTHCMITADFTQVDGTMSEVSTITRPENLWFYEHVQETYSKHKAMDSKSSAIACHQEIISTEEYLHRHERGAFWMARPEGEIERCLLFQGRIFGWCLDILSRKDGIFRSWPRIDECWKTGYLFRLLRSLPQAIGADNFLITDVYTDIDKVAQLVGMLRDWDEKASSCPYKLNTPIWLCPIRVPDRQQLLSPHGHRGGEKRSCCEAANNDSSSQGPLVLIDVGLYGRVLPSAGASGERRYVTALDAAKWFEKWGLEHNARKMLYSLNFYTKESDFWEHSLDSGNSTNALKGVRFNRTLYDSLRKKYGAEGRLPDLYTKVGNSEPRVENSRRGLRYWMWSAVCALT